MSAGIPTLVSLWCHQCQGLVSYEGHKHGERSDDPVHVTPELLAAHRAEAHR